MYTKEDIKKMKLEDIALFLNKYEETKKALNIEINGLGEDKRKKISQLDEQYKKVVEGIDRFKGLSKIDQTVEDFKLKGYVVLDD